MDRAPDYKLITAANASESEDENEAQPTARITTNSVETSVVRFADSHTRDKRKEIDTGRVDDRKQDEKFKSYTNILRIIKVISLLLIGGCALFGLVFSKLTFVSITSRMYTLYRHSDHLSTDDENIQKCIIVFQLVFILVIPEIVCLGHCLLWGCIGKSSKNFPWPSRKALFLVSILKWYMCSHEL